MDNEIDDELRVKFRITGHELAHLVFLRIFTPDQKNWLTHRGVSFLGFSVLFKIPATVENWLSKQIKGVDR